MNKVLLVGRVARDVEVKTTPAGRDYSFNAIACKREYKNKDGKYDVDFIPLTFGNQTSKFVKEYVKKGDLIEIVGRWHIFTDKDNKIIHECIVDTVTLVEKKLEDRLGNNPTVDEIGKDIAENPEDPDLPF